MSHLSPDDLVEAFDGEPSPRAAAHLAECATCRQQADALAATRDAMRDADVPEPTPLFWSHFAARVSEAARAAAPSPRHWWLSSWHDSRWSWPLAAAAVFVVAIAASLVLRTGRSAPPEAARAVAIAPSATTGAAALDEEPPWALMTDVTDDMDWDTVVAAGLGPLPGTADRAVTHLSESERGELAGLLARELAVQPSPREPGGRI